MFSLFLFPDEEQKTANNRSPLPSVSPVVSCADPGKVEHSRRVLSGPHFTVGSTIQYICNKGFTLSGNSLLTCFNRGSSGPKWNQKLPRCQRMCQLKCSSGARLHHTLRLSQYDTTVALHSDSQLPVKCRRLSGSLCFTVLLTFRERQSDSAAHFTQRLSRCVEV